MSTQTKNLTDSQSYCELCNHTGWIINENNEATPCKCMLRQKLNNRIKFASIPESFKDNRLSEFHRDYYHDKKSIDEVIKAIKTYLANLDEMFAEGVGFYFYSNAVGSGKTRMATSLANELIYEHDKSVRFATSVDIISAIRATWDKEYEEFSSEHKLINYLTTVEVLVIDDFGSEKYKEWLDDRFYQIINTRYVNRLVTFYTSNKSLDQLEYDKRITNRIKERVFQVHFPEESIRDGIARARQRKMEKEMANGRT